MSYVVGISSGAFAAAPQQEKIRYVTLSRKALASITEGVNFVQIDLESIAEFKEPDLMENIKNVKKLGITFGIHGESVAFGGREVPTHLDSAIEDEYRRSHERLLEALEHAGKIGSKYYLLHASETVPFIILGTSLQPTSLVDWWGRPLSKLLEEDEELWEWAVKQDFILEPGRGVRLRSLEEWKRIARDEMLEEWVREFLMRERRNPTEEEIRRKEEEIRPEVERRAINYAKRSLRDYIETRDLAYGAERIAYYIVAKWMEKHNDPLWINITGGGSMDDKDFREGENYQKWVPAVAAKYLWGHFNQDKCPDPEYRKKDPKEILKKYGMYFVIESGMPPGGMEGLLRLCNPLHFHYLAKEVGLDYLRICIDPEHVMMNNLDPEKVIDSLPEDGGKSVLVLHLGWPTTAGSPVHMPVFLASEQQVYLYKLLYKLRQKGFTCKEEDGYLVFEKGPFGPKETIVVLRKIVEFLEKDVPPDKLPLEFFGIATGEMISEERQLAAIREHAFDPLKGLLMVPEEEYGIFGAAAAEKGKAEVWKKEKYK